MDCKYACNVVIDLEFTPVPKALRKGSGLSDLPARWMDIQRLYSYFLGLGRKKVSLGNAADWLGIANSKERAHRALYDAQLTAKIFHAMSGGELAEHRARMKRETRNVRQIEACSANLASRCDGLAELMASLRREETRAA